MEAEKPENLKQYRKAVYDFLRDKGCVIGSKVQPKLSKLLKSIYEHRVSVLTPNQPVIHEIKCPSCQGIKVFKKQGFKRYKAGIRKAGGEAPPIQKQ